MKSSGGNARLEELSPRVPQLLVTLAADDLIAQFGRKVGRLVTASSSTGSLFFSSNRLRLLAPWGED